MGGEEERRRPTDPDRQARREGAVSTAAPRTVRWRVARGAQRSEVACAIPPHPDLTTAAGDPAEATDGLLPLAARPRSGRVCGRFDAPTTLGLPPRRSGQTEAHGGGGAGPMVPVGHQPAWLPACLAWRWLSRRACCRPVGGVCARLLRVGRVAVARRFPLLRVLVGRPRQRRSREKDSQRRDNTWTSQRRGGSAERERPARGSEQTCHSTVWANVN